MKFHFEEYFGPWVDIMQPMFTIEVVVKMYFDQVNRGGINPFLSKEDSYDESKRTSTKNEPLPKMLPRKHIIVIEGIHLSPLVEFFLNCALALPFFYFSSHSFFFTSLPK